MVLLHFGNRWVMICHILCPYLEKVRFRVVFLYISLRPIQLPLTADPVLSGRASFEQNWIEMVGNEFAEHFAVIPCLEDEKIGYQQLVKLDVRG